MANVGRADERRACQRTTIPPGVGARRNTSGGIAVMTRRGRMPDEVSAHGAHIITAVSGVTLSRLRAKQFNDTNKKMLQTSVVQREHYSAVDDRPSNDLKTQR